MPTISCDGDDLDFDGDVSVTYIFGNLWYGFGDMLNMGGLSPYIGGGLGVGFVNVDIDAIERRRPRRQRRRDGLRLPAWAAA